jgi:hypothetical protein
MDATKHLVALTKLHNQTHLVEILTKRVGWNFN